MTLNRESIEVWFEHLGKTVSPLFAEHWRFFVSTAFLLLMQALFALRILVFGSCYLFLLKQFNIWDYRDPSENSPAMPFSNR